MNKTVLAVIIAALVIIGGVGVYMMMSKSKSAGQTTEVPATNETAETQPSTTTSAEQKSLKDLIGSGQPQECTFNDGAGNEGVVHVADSKMRGDFQSTAAGQSTNTHMIVDGSTSYMWIEGQKSGFKMSIDAASQAGAQTTGKQTSVDLNEKFDYDCKNWNSDSSLFSLPTDVEFSDFGAVTVPNTGNIQCSTCDSLPLQSQAECKTALGCE